MAYVLYQARIQPLSPFSTLLVGDTFFGQCCWAAREIFGELHLNHLLQGYTTKQPWLVCSDAFPANYLPKPTLPMHLFQTEQQGIDRKKAKNNQWLLLDLLVDKVQVAFNQAVSTKEALGEHTPKTIMQMHNSINRLTGTTGEGFSPFTVGQTYYGSQSLLDIYLVADDEKMNQADLEKLMTYVGEMGYGKDASTGLGKFSLKNLKSISFDKHPNSNAYMTLAPCVPEKDHYDSNMSFWRTKTKFGRHGNVYATGGQPYKAPMMFAQSAAVLTPKSYLPNKLFIGQGLGGDGSLSNADSKTVHQGYAPVISIAIG